MIIFKKVKAKNFFSVGNTPIEITLNSHRKTCVIGTNGACKSGMVLDSIVFGLFGKPFRKINKTSVINSINKGDCVVEVYFSIGNKEYKIIRGLKPNIFEIYCDDKLINQDSKTKDYQEYLEANILRTNYKSFINTVILGSARYNPFMTLSPADRREIIEDLLDIQVFSVMNVLVKDKLSKLKEQLTELKYSIELTQEKINLQKQNLEENKNNIEIQINEKIEEVKKSKDQISALQNEIELIQKHIDAMQNKIRDQLDLEQKKKKFITIESKLETNIKKVKKEQAFYSENDNCPTCKQSIDAGFKTTQLELLDKKSEELNQGMQKLEEELVKLQNRINEINGVNKHISEHQNEIIRHNSSILSINKYVQKELKSIDELKNLVLVETDEKLSLLIDELRDKNVQFDELMNDKKYYDYSMVLLKDTGIKSKIIKQYIPILNKLINTYLGKFNFFVDFNLDENFNEIIKSRYRDSYQYNFFSEGEKLRIDLSLLFAFRQVAKMKNSVNTNLLIMDEILDSSLDGDGIEQFFELLDFAFDDKVNIFIISHKESLVDNFNRVLKFEKKKNFTRMKELEV